MTYYLLLPGDSEEDAMYETNILGEVSFDTFYAGQGMVALNNIINEGNALDLREDMDIDTFIKSLKIYDEKKKQYTITEFMDILSKHKVRMG